jgi:hypothetical protein
MICGLKKFADEDGGSRAREGIRREISGYRLAAQVKRRTFDRNRADVMGFRAWHVRFRDTIAGYRKPE